MNIKNIVMSLLLVCGVMPMVAQQGYFRDESGRTELMNYIMSQEEQIKAAREDISRLWDICYESGNGSTDLAHVHRRASCTDADIHALIKREVALRSLIDSSVLYIRHLASQSNLAAQDNKGLTVLNYCHTFEIYTELRRQGTPFQTSVWAYFHPTTAAFVGSVAATVVGASVVTLHQFARANNYIGN